jgi:small-conductance mechanosensitive channel
VRAEVVRARHGLREVVSSWILGTTLIAAAAIAIDVEWGDIHSRAISPRVVAFVTSLAFLVFAVVTVRKLASQLARVVAPYAEGTSTAAFRIVVTIAGYLVVLFVTLGMLGVSPEHLIVGGAVTGVIVGIAAQQSLSNVFAGIVLLLARPFTVGSRVRIRSGALGGIFEGTVIGMSLTYVTLETDDGRLSVPNSAMLAGAVGPAPPPASKAESEGGGTDGAGVVPEVGPHDGRDGAVLGPLE